MIVSPTPALPKSKGFGEGVLEGREHRRHVPSIWRTAAGVRSARRRFDHAHRGGTYLIYIASSFILLEVFFVVTQLLICVINIMVLTFKGGNMLF